MERDCLPGPPLREGFPPAVSSNTASSRSCYWVTLRRDSGSLTQTNASLRKQHKMASEQQVEARSYRVLPRAEAFLYLQSE